MDELTQIESRLALAHDDLTALYGEITGEDLQSAVVRDAVKKVLFYLPTVLVYLKHGHGLDTV